MRPTPAQLARFTADLHAKHDHIPGMAARIDRAAALAAAGDVRPTLTGCTVLSARNDDTGYTLDAKGRCTCPDSVSAAPRVQGLPFCKHRLAYILHHRALVEMLAQRILGRNDYANRRHQCNHPNVFLLLFSGDKGRTALLSDRVGFLAYVIWSTPLSAWQPATPADMLALEQWLDHANAFPVSTVEEEAVLALTDRMDAMARDAEYMPFPDWRDLYAPALHR